MMLELESGMGNAPNTPEVPFVKRAWLSKSQSTESKKE